MAAIPLSHYEVLGIDRHSSRAEIRMAYVALARDLHPDRLVGADPELRADSARAMQAVNDAWRVLGDPARRIDYDRQLAAASSPASDGSRTGPLVDVDVDVDVDPRDVPLRPPPDLAASLVRSLPWVAILGVLVAIFVFSAFARRSESGPTPVAELLGQCVATATGGTLVPVACDEENDGRVVASVAEVSDCPPGSRPVANGSGHLCLEPADSSGSVR